MCLCVFVHVNTVRDYNSPRPKKTYFVVGGFQVFVCLGVCVSLFLYVWVKITESSAGGSSFIDMECICCIL